MSSATVKFVGGGSIDADPVMVVNQGASFGPRVATAAFSTWRDRPLQRYSVAVDVDGATYQDDGAVRRRAALGAVTVAKRVAALVKSGELWPDLRWKNQDAGWIAASWSHQEDFEGFGRRVNASVEMRVEADELTLPNEVAAIVADHLRWMSDGLHGAIDLPQNRFVFGGR